MCGGNANMDEIMAVVKEHNLKLVEDAGQAFAASWVNQLLLIGAEVTYLLDQLHHIFELKH